MKEGEGEGEGGRVSRSTVRGGGGAAAAAADDDDDDDDDDGDAKELVNVSFAEPIFGAVLLSVT